LHTEQHSSEKVKLKTQGKKKTKKQNKKNVAKKICSNTVLKTKSLEQYSDG
jgi:hypothetical protein